MANHRVAIVNHFDASAVHIIDFDTGVEVRRSFAWQEAFDGLHRSGETPALNRFVVESDDDVFRYMDLDGVISQTSLANTLVPAPSIRFASGGEYMCVMNASRSNIYIETPDGTLVRDVDVAAEMPSIYGTPYDGTDEYPVFFQGAITWITNDNTGLVMVRVPVPSGVPTKTTIPNWGALNGHQVRLVNGDLHIVADSMNYVENPVPGDFVHIVIDSSLSQTGYYPSFFAEAYGFYTYIGEYNYIKWGRYVPYLNATEKDLELLGGSLRVYDLLTQTGSVITLVAPTDAHIPGIEAAIVNDSVYVQAFTLLFGDELVSTIRGGIPNNSSPAQGWLLRRSITTGAIIAAIQIEFDSKNNGGGVDFVSGFVIPVYEVAGTITAGGNGLQARVILLDEDSNTFLGETTCDVNGDYSFEVFSARPKTVIAEHPSTKARKAAYNITPTLLP
jgi:hypothetical protein